MFSKMFKNRETPVQKERQAHRAITRHRFASSVSAVATDGAHTMFMKSDNTLWSTGANNYGQLGDGTTEPRQTPVQVASDVSAVSAGVYYTMFIKSDNTLWAMGDNGFGQLGDGTSDDRYIPVQVIK